MANLEVEVKVVGADQASNDLKDFGNSAKDAGDNIKTAGSNVQTTASKLSDFKTNLVGVAGSLTSVSTGIIGVVSSFTRLEQAQIRVDSANRKVETSAIAVTKAQEKYNDAVKKYGENSSQAQKAAESLKTAQEGHSIAIDRAELAQSRLNETMASFGSEIANNVIGVFGSIVSAITTFATKGESGVSLAGKLKQSFLDLVSGGSNVKSTLDTAGGAMGGLGTNAEAAGKSAGTLRSEVAQLGGGIAQAIPNIGQFSGGITNTAAAAERTAGPLGNIERSVASVAGEVGTAVTPLGAFAGGMGATGTAAEGAVGGLEAAAASTGALEAGSVTAAAESAGLASAIGGVSAGLAAETAGISLAVAALALYVFNIGGAKDKTDAAVTSAKNFLAVGWDSFAQKFKPVNDVLDKTIGQWVTLLDKQKQFSEQPLPGKAPAPGGTQGTLDEIIARENAPKANQPLPGKDQSLQNLLLFGGAQVLSDQLEAVNKYRSALQGLTVATEPLKTGIKGDTSAISQLTIDLKAGSTAAETAAAAHQKLLQPVQLVSRESTLQAQAINQAKDAMNQTVSITQNAAQGAQQYGNTIRTLTDETKNLKTQQDAFTNTIRSVDDTLSKLKGTIQANDQILQSSVEVQKLWDTGWDQMTVKLQQAQQDLITSEGALSKLDQALATGQPQLTAYNQGWVDFNQKMDEAILTANKAQGGFDAFITTLGTGKQSLADFATGFTEGEQDIQKWATAIEQGTAKLEGQQSALDQFDQKVGVQIPASIRTSIDRQKEWTDIILKTPDALQKLADSADKVFQSVADGWAKVFQSTNQQDFGKNLFTNLQGQVQKFGTVLSPVTNTVGQFMGQMQTIMQQGIDRTRAELASAVFQAPSLNLTNLTTSKNSLQTMMNQMNGLFNNFGNQLPAATQKFKPLIAAINDFGQHARDPMQVQQAIGLMNLAMDAALNPMDAVKQSMLDQGLAAVGLARNADGTLRPIQAVGQNSQQATDPTKKMADALSSMSSQAKTLQDTITHMPDAIAGLPAKIDASFTTPWLKAIGSISSGISGLIDNIAAQFSGAGNSQLAGIVGAIDKNFKQPFLTAIGSISSAISGLVDNINTQLAGINDVTLTVTANTGFAASALSTLLTSFVNPLKQPITITPTANTGFAASALSTLVTSFINPLKQPIVITPTANTGFAASALSTLVTSFIVPLKQPIVITPTANTGFAASALSTLLTSFINPLKQPITITPQANTGFAASAIQALQNMLNILKQPITITPQANTGFAASAIQALQQMLAAMIRTGQTPIVVQVDTSAAQMAINRLRMQLLQLQSVGQPGVPLQSRFGAEKGGTFALGPSGFVPVKQEHAAQGGSFVVTKQMKLGNLTVGEGNKPELLSYIPTRAGGKHVGMLTVIPLPTLKAAAGGVFGATPNLSSPPTMSFMPQTGQPISYGAGLPAPGASTVGAGTRLGYVEAGPGVVQQGPPSSDPNLQAKPGPVTSPGNFFSVGPGTLPAGLSGGQQQGQVSTSIVEGINDTSPYDQAQLTGESVAAEIKPQQQEMQSQLTDLLTMIKQMIRKMGTRDINANLMIDGQKMASTVQKYMGNDAYGGR